MDKELYVVGMPRSASEFFYYVLSDIAEDTKAYKVITQVGEGRQHLTYGKTFMLCKTRQVTGIYRDIRDVLVSTYFYVMRLHEQMLDPRVFANREGIVKEKLHEHPLYESIKNCNSDSDAFDILIDHPNCLDRYVKWFRDYYGKPFVYLVKYDNMISSAQRETLLNMFRDLDIDVPLSAIVQALQKNTYDHHKQDNPVHYDKELSRSYRIHLSKKQIQHIEWKYRDFFIEAGICLPSAYAMEKNK